MKVFNKHKDQIPKDAVYIGRGSSYGNPYTHMEGKTLAEFKVDTREESIKKYEDYIRSNPELIEKVKRDLKGKDLVCFCKPLPCHGDILIKIANEE